MLQHVTINPEAIYADGSCAIDDECGVCGGDNSTCGGCIDASACNYDASAIIDDGSVLVMRMWRLWYRYC